MSLSVDESITISEIASIVVTPGLYQSSLGMVAGSKYRLLFDENITSGVLKIYQGSLLIYDSSKVLISPANMLDSLSVSEKVTIEIPTDISVYDSTTLSENFSRA